MARKGGPPPGMKERRSLRSRLSRRLGRIPHPHIPNFFLTRVKVFRLFSLLFVFSFLVGYVVFRSPRAQELARRKTQQILSEKLHREVRIGGFDLALLPPSVVVRDFWIANDPRGLPGPCFSASEIELRGFPTFSKNRIDIPKLRVVMPRIDLELFEDGTTNLPSLPESSPSPDAGKGLDVRLGEAVIQRGTIRFREWNARLDAILYGTGVTAQSSPFSKVTKVSLLSRKGEFLLDDHKDAERLKFSIAAEATLSPGRVHLDSLRLDGDRLRLRASGGVDDLKTAIVTLVASATTDGDSLDKLFGVGIPLTGDVAMTGTVRIEPGKGFLVNGRFEVLEGAKFAVFPMTGSGLIRVDPHTLLVDVTRGEYAGGSLEASVRIVQLDTKPLPIRILAKARGLSYEQFLADLGLAGTGHLARADLDLTMTFLAGAVEKADGAGLMRLTAFEGASAVRGRHPLPTSGGGPLLIRAGKIDFGRMPMRAGGVDVNLDGTISLGDWTPDLTLVAEADDLRDLEKLAENWYPAIQKEALKPPLKLGGSGKITAHLTRAFSDPHIEASVKASDFVLRGVRFGEATGSITVDHNVATLSPFTSSDEEGSLTVTGKIGWGGALRGEYRMDGFVADFQRWPLERVLQFLDFDLPLTGLVTGRLPLDGVTPEMTGTVPLVWERARFWGQPAERVEGQLTFLEDRLTIERTTAVFGTGTIFGNGMFRYADKGFSLALGAKALPLSSLSVASEKLGSLTGTLSGTLTGDGTVDLPDFEVDGTLVDPRWEGKPIGKEGKELALRATAVEGAWSGVLTAPEAATVSFRSTGPKTDVTLDASSLAPFAPLLQAPAEAGLDGKLRVTAQLVQGEDGSLRTADGSVEHAELSLYGRTIQSDDAAFHLVEGKLRFDRLELSARTPNGDPRRAGSLVLAGDIGLEEPYTLALTAAGSFDASLLRPFVPDAEMAGSLAVDLRVGGDAKNPFYVGRVGLENVDFLASGSTSPFESINGTLLLTPGRLTLDALTLRYGGGTVGLGGLLSLNGNQVERLRVNAHLSRVKQQTFEGFGVTVSGDLVFLGDSWPRTVTGELTLDRGLYDQDVSLGLDALLGKLRPTQTASPVESRLDRVTLDVLIDVPPSAFQIRNNVARIQGSGELRATGTFRNPILGGQIDAEDGGRLFIKDHRYDVLSGKILFSNSAKIDPFFELEARTTIRDYQITLGVTGTMARLAVRLGSDPQLSEAQIVSLIVTGELPTTNNLGVPVGSAPVSTDESISKAAREILASVAIDQVAQGAKKLFKVDRLQIDPVFIGSSFSAPRLTIGKAITKDLTVTYSYKASANAEQILLVEYQITPTAFLQFARDENGIVSLDIKLRQRLR